MLSLLTHRLLRKNSEALQLSAPCTLYRALTHWDKLLEGLGDGSGVPKIVNRGQLRKFLLTNNSVNPQAKYPSYNFTSGKTSLPQVSERVTS